MNQISFLNNIDPQSLEAMYERYLADNESVDIQWQKFFAGFDFAQQNNTLANKQPVANSSNLQQTLLSSESAEKFRKETAVNALIQEYRNRGHLFAKTNPIRPRRIYSPPITIDRFGLNADDLSASFHSGSTINIGFSSLRNIISHLEETYCRSVGCEYSFIGEPHLVDWLNNKIENSKNTTAFSVSAKKRILKSLCKAVTFEQFTHTRFIGQKRFSLEGLEAIIPALDTIIEKGALINIKEIVVGMAHRGRLNVLGNIFQKDFQNIFSEFEAKGYQMKKFLGDVKYHLGSSVNITTASGKAMHLSMLPNPSHLEAVNPVVAGVTRAKLDFRHNSNIKSIVPILFHGDAAISGQGINYELLQMSKLPAYNCGGTIHIVMNNQIGFTTNYLEGRSSTYCTDIAKIINCPVFHVNGDDIEAVVHVALLALEFRQKFHRDVFIDILGYRRHGHNEGDDPNLTQPILYDLIRKHPNPLEIYSQKLLAEKTVTKEYVEKVKQDFWDMLDDKMVKAKKLKATPIISFLKGDWINIKLGSPELVNKKVITGVDKKAILEIANKLTSLPEDQQFIPKIHMIQKTRRKEILENDTVNWASAEALAFGSLLEEKKNIRFSGQDVLRGTFSQRHMMFRSSDESTDYYPLKNLSSDQGRFMVYNSLLSEYAVLGYEYGYAMAQPNTLTIWEAQFGDFVNGAQIIIDQFIAAAETKWQRMNGITLLLPHGQEGQGPEHSSARVERFLSLCAENNMIVANITTPANYFHALRHQLLANYRKPLVIFSPKSLLRHPQCISTIDELCAENYFKPILDDNKVPKDKVTRLLFCSGKIYYELLKHRTDQAIDNVAIIRLEQLYPFMPDKIQKIVNQYQRAKEIFWVQEEPENQGPLHFIAYNWKCKLNIKRFISREAYATSATGFSTVFKEQQNKIIKQAFA